jgi:hypothetical protein
MFVCAAKKMMKKIILIKKNDEFQNVTISKSLRFEPKRIKSFQNFQ